MEIEGGPSTLYMKKRGVFSENPPPFHPTNNEWCIMLDWSITYELSWVSESPAALQSSVLVPLADVQVPSGTVDEPSASRACSRKPLNLLLPTPDRVTGRSGIGH